MKRHFYALAASVAVAGFTAPAMAQNFIISSSLPQAHLWTGGHMVDFMKLMEESSGGSVTFTPFFAGELTGVGRELDALQGGTIQIAAPLLAPYHEGAFPLSDVTQLPTYGTDSPMVTRAFQKLLDSDVVLADGKTFYQYEIEPKEIRVWAVGATSAYSIATAGTPLVEPADFRGMPLRAGSAIHTLVLNELGATPVTMPASNVYEALSRGTVNGLVLAISDWPAYSLEALMKNTITDVSIGHWESYLAISNEAWDQMDENTQKSFDAAARKAAENNSLVWDQRLETVKKDSIEKYGAKFTPVTEYSQAMQDYIAAAGASTWKTWIEKLEGEGHPARATASLYARIILDEGGKLPEGVAEYLNL
ncbi:MULTISPECIES: TRAP transporter substrate-binding protein [unclassified Haematobacter]|uniref:TRAP transporter substrate-binding protein n=1 Tax=unclassified Haematobacter TaxID=2640585 RepID=UPI0025BC29EB|nr:MULTISPECIES: TRAP transporter substrate-binding protein DctP [unclassified Haematobacter]